MTPLARWGSKNTSSAEDSPEAREYAETLKDLWGEEEVAKGD